MRNSTARKIVLLVTAIVTALGIGELVIRVGVDAPAIKTIELASPNCVYKRSTNPLLGFELKPNFENDKPDYIESYEQTNSYGQRDVEHTVAKKPEHRRVLLLGDSVVEGYGLPQTATISSQLQELYGDKVEVLNFGVSAYCTLAEVELLATKGVKFDPDIVVLVFVENDFDNFNREAFPLGETIDRPAFAGWLFKRSHLCRLAFLQFDLFYFRAETDPVTWNASAIGDNNVSVGIKRLRDLADQYDFQPVIAIWPRFLHDKVVDVHKLPDGEQLIIEALAAQHAIPSFRLSEHFQRLVASDASRSPKLRFSQGDELHPSAEGARIAAFAIHSALSAGIEKLVVQPNGASAADITQAISKLGGQPNYARVYNRIGNELLKAGDLERAIEQYNMALAEDPLNAATHNNLGIALQRAGLPNAEEHYRKAIEFEPDFAEAHFNLGVALEEADRAKSQSLFVTAIKLQPDFLPAHLRLSKSLLLDGRRRAGEAGLREVLRMDGENQEALLSLANELAKQRRFPEARPMFERFIALRADHAEALNNLGAICSALGDSASARKHFEAALAADPSHPKAAKNLENLLNTTN